MSEPKRATWPRTPPPLRSDWCIEGVPALDDDACYVLPEAPTSELLIYLHGIVPPEVTSPIKTNFQNVVASASRSAGVVALLPRGKLGLAPRGYSRWWGWPTSDSSYRVHGPELAALIEVKRRQLEAALGTRFDRVYVAGSSSGGYFASALALKGGIQADGFGAMSSGHGVSLLGRVAHAPRPFYIGFGSYDNVERSARALAQFLRDAHWPVRVAEHPVGHGAKRVYLEEAFTFWRSSGAAAQ